MAAAPTINPDPGSLPAKVRYGRAPKPSPRAAEVGVSSQEAVEYAINYAKQQRQLQEVQTGSQQHHAGRGRRLSGPECEKHYHAVTKTQPRQLTAGADLLLTDTSMHICTTCLEPIWPCRQPIRRCGACGR